MCLFRKLQAAFDPQTSKKMFFIPKVKNKEFSFLSRQSWCLEGFGGAASSDRDTFSSWHFVRMSDILPSLSKPLRATLPHFSNFLSCILKMCGCLTWWYRAPADKHSCRWCRSVYLLNLLKQSAITESVQQRSSSPNVPDLADMARNFTTNNSSGCLQQYLLNCRTVL